MNKMLDLYTDYLLSSFHHTTATGLSRLTDGTISHDKISRYLNEPEKGSKELWQSVKPLVRQHENAETGCLIFDDSIIEKPYSDESALITWHYDHSKGTNVKGINILSAFYHNGKDDGIVIRVPVMYQLILKTILFCVVKTKKVKRKCETTKNEYLCQMVGQMIHNQLKFRYVLVPSTRDWFASSANMRFIHKKKKYFIFDLKSIPIAIGTIKNDGV